MVEKLPFKKNDKALITRIGLVGVGKSFLSYVLTRIFNQIARVLHFFRFKWEAAAIWILKRQAADESSLELYKNFLPRILCAPVPIKILVPNYFKKAFQNITNFVHSGSQITSYAEASTQEPPDLVILNMAMIGSIGDVLINIIRNYDVIYEGAGYVVIQLRTKPSLRDDSRVEEIEARLKLLLGETDIKQIEMFNYKFVVRSRTMDEGIIQEVRDEYFEWVNQLDGPFKTVFDIGSQIGSFSVLVSSLVSSTGTIHAFEPEPANFSLLQQNISMNSLGNRVIAHQAAISDTTGLATLSVSSDNTGGNKLNVSESSSLYSVQVKSIDILEYIESLRIDSIDLIKIDCEGWEYPILKRLAPKLGIVKALVGEIQNSQFGPPQKTLDLLEKAGFQCETRGSSGQILFFAHKVIKG